MNSMMVRVLVFLFLFEACHAKDEPATAPNTGGGSFLVVKITGLDKKVTFKVMTRQEYSELSSQISAEASNFEKAIAAAQKEWKSNPETMTRTFPRNSIAQRKANVTQTLSSRELAESKLVGIQKRAADQAALDKQREDAKNKMTVMTDKGPMAVDKPKTAAEQSKQQMEDQRAQLIKKAREMFEAKLTEMVVSSQSNTTKPAGNTRPAK